ncbi:MAG: sulfite exporter TauE/SafE family protein [Terriglobia bacterium]
MSIKDHFDGKRTWSSLDRKSCPFSAAVLGGALNSVAGGGSFFTFPALVLFGMPPVNANATNTVVLWPGSLASVHAYRKEFATEKHRLRVYGAVSLLGGVLGALLLLNTKQSTFQKLIPYLLLLATLLFTFGGSAAAWVRSRFRFDHDSTSRGQIGILFLQLLIAIYGGYFGGGIGILMLALLSVLGMENIHAMNALKTLFATCINGMAVITFIVAGAVIWSKASLMIGGAVLGGYGGAYFAQKINPLWVRRFVTFTGLILTVYFFYKY